MKFGEVLRELSENTLFEENVWEALKEPLQKIAKENHPDGCHVNFIDFSSTCICKLKELIENQDIKFVYDFSGGDTNATTITWNHNKKNICISNKVLCVTNNERIEVNIDALEYMRRGYSYVKTV